MDNQLKIHKIRSKNVQTIGEKSDSKNLHDQLLLKMWKWATVTWVKMSKHYRNTVHYSSDAPTKCLLLGVSVSLIKHRWAGFICSCDVKVPANCPESKKLVKMMMMAGALHGAFIHQCLILSGEFKVTRHVNVSF